MHTPRRAVLATVASALVAGCTGDGDQTDTASTTPSTTPTVGETATPSGGDTPECDPADVTRPPVASGSNIDGRPYPQKPAELTEQSVLAYLDEFETAFAWNRVLQTEGVTSLNVDNLDGFDPDETGDGFLASSSITVSYSTEKDGRSERTYTANYFVAPELVYRTESSGEPATPTEQGEETQLVQCGSGGSSK